MKNLTILSTQEITTKHSFRLVSESQIRIEAEILMTFSDVDVAVTDIEIARELGCKHWNGEEAVDVASRDFYERAPAWLRKKHEQRVISTLSISRSVERRKVKSLSEIDVKELSKSGGVYVIWAPTGHSKTKSVAGPAFVSAVEQGQRASAITPLISICKTFHNHAERELGESVAYYDSMVSADRQKRGIVTTINSSAKPGISAMTETADVLVAEEFCASLEVVAESRELAGQRRAIWNQLKRTLRTVKTAFLLDADFSDEAIDFIRECGREPIVIEIEPDYSDISVTISEHGQLVNDMKAAAEAGERVLITTDSKAGAEKYAHMLREIPGVLLIHADNKGRPAQKAFLENPNGNLAGVNVLIYSPVMNRSISIETEHFTRHFAVFTGVLTPLSCVQQIRRDRTARHFDIAIDAVGRIGWLDDVGAYDGEDKIICAIRERNRYLRESISSSLKITLEHLKFRVERAEFDGDAGAAGFREVAQAARDIKNEYVAGVMSAELVSTESAKNMKHRDDLTDEQFFQREATLINRMCGELTRESIDFYGRGAGEKVMDRHEILLMSAESRAYADQFELGYLECDKKNREFFGSKLEWVFDQCIDSETGRVEADGKLALKIVNELKRYKTTNKLGIVRLEEKARYSEDTALRKLGEIFRALGYKTRNRKSDDVKVMRVNGIENVDRFVSHKFGKVSLLSTMIAERTALAAA